MLKRSQGIFYWFQARSALKMTVQSQTVPVHCVKLNKNVSSSLGCVAAKMVSSLVILYWKDCIDTVDSILFSTVFSTVFLKLMLRFSNLILHYFFTVL